MYASRKKRLVGEDNEPICCAAYHNLTRQLGLSLSDLKEMSIGMVFDLAAIRSGDYVRQASQADIDRLLGG